MGNIGKWFQLAFFLALAVSPYIYLAWRVSRLEREVEALRRWQPKEDSPRLSLYHRQKLREAARSLEAFITKKKEADVPDPHSPSSPEALSTFKNPKKVKEPEPQAGEGWAPNYS